MASNPAQKCQSLRLAQNILTFNNSVIYSLLGGEDDIKLFVSVLEAFRPAFDPPVPVQHVQDAILCVSGVMVKGTAVLCVAYVYM